jgi:DNA-directed RNA polymerase specialized sigma24 family protein
MGDKVRRNSYWCDRLNRWALWVFSSPGRARAWYVERVDCAVQFGNLTPAINDEAIVTDQLVGGLPAMLKAAVKAVYLDGVGNSMEGTARRLRISERTLHTRLCHADLRLDIALDARESQARRAA